jgi:hypothetical protein
LVVLCRALRNRIGDALTPEEYDAAEELGIMADQSGDGTLFQIFTGAVGDRPTFFFEVIQRRGCMNAVPVATPPAQAAKEALSAELAGSSDDSAMLTMQMVQVAGCGGFGKGNVNALYASMEKYDERLKEDSDFDTSEIACMSPSEQQVHPQRPFTEAGRFPRAGGAGSSNMNARKYGEV